MTEKEKMLAGMAYNASDPQLVEDRKRAKKLCKKYNDLDPDNYEERKKVLAELFTREHDAYIEPNFFCDYGYNIHIGKRFYANHNLVILDVNTVTIGDNVMLAPNVQIYTATHPVDAAERISGTEFGFPIEIGDNVWIGGGSIICPGVKVGNNTTIGTGSVVTKDIPANVVAAGNPCRVIREL